MADYLVETFKTDAALTYDENKAFGNDSAGKNLWVSLTDDDTVGLAANNATLIGRLLEVRRNKTCSVEVMALRVKAVAGAAITRGSQIVGAGGGKVKAVPADTSGADAGLGRGRGIVKKAAAANNDVIDVMFL